MNSSIFIKRLHTCHVEAQANANLNHQNTHNTNVVRVKPKVRKPVCAFAKFSCAHTLSFEAHHLKRFIQMRHEFLSEGTDSFNDDGSEGIAKPKVFTPYKNGTE